MRIVALVCALGLALVAAPALLAQGPAPASCEPGQVPMGGGLSGTSAQSPFERADVRAISERLTCYCGCPHLQVSKCFCGTADAIRTDLAARLDAGQTPEGVIAAYLAEHGNDVLAVPPRRGLHHIIWLAPILAIVAGAAGIAMVASRWRKTAPAPVLLADAASDTRLAEHRAELERALREQ